MPRPDAVRMPEAFKDGDTHLDRIDSILDTAEPILQVDRGNDEKGWIRKIPGGKLLITRDPEDSEFFPKNHPQAGKPRYRWEATDRPGIDVGYLREEAKG